MQVADAGCKGRPIFVLPSALEMMRLFFLDISLMQWCHVRFVGVVWAIKLLCIKFVKSVGNVLPIET